MTYLEKIKVFKNFLSLNLMSFVGYLSFLNTLITLFIAKPILTDTSNMDKMFWGVAYNLYTVKVILIQIAIAIAIFYLYKYERYLLIKQKKENFINSNNIIFKTIFYIGFILFFIPLFIFNKAVILILLFLFEAFLELLGLLNFKFLNLTLLKIQEHSLLTLIFLIFLCVLIYANSTRQSK